MMKCQHCASVNVRWFTPRSYADRAAVVLKRYLSAAHRDDTARGCPLPAVVGEVGTTAAFAH